MTVEGLEQNILSPTLSWKDLPRDPEMADATIKIFIAGFIFWFIVMFGGGYYHPIPAKFAAKMKPYDKLIYRHRLTCIYHGAIAFTSSLYWYINMRDLTDGRWNTIYEIFMMSNTANHFIWDTIFMQYNGFLDMGNFLHHAFGVSTYFATAYCQHNYWALGLNILPAECSNIQMHMREVYKRIGWRYTKSYYLNEYGYFLLYLICRSMWIPACYYWMWNANTVNPVVMVIYPLHCLMSWYYVSHIPNLIVARWKELGKISKVGFKLTWTQPLDAEQVAKAGIRSIETYST